MTNQMFRKGTLTHGLHHNFAKGEHHVFLSFKKLIKYNCQSNFINCIKQNCVKIKNKIYFLKMNSYNLLKHFHKSWRADQAMFTEPDLHNKIS